jgi:hypothetical protein
MPSRGESSGGIHFTAICRVAKKTTLADFVCRLNFQFLVSQCRVAKKDHPVRLRLPEALTISRLSLTRAAYSPHSSPSIEGNYGNDCSV